MPPRERARVQFWVNCSFKEDTTACFWCLKRSTSKSKTLRPTVQSSSSSLLFCVYNSLLSSSVLCFSNLLTPFSPSPLSPPTPKRVSSQQWERGKEREAGWERFERCQSTRKEFCRRSAWLGRAGGWWNPSRSSRVPSAEASPKKIKKIKNKRPSGFYLKRQHV